MDLTKNQKIIIGAMLLLIVLVSMVAIFLIGRNQQAANSGQPRLTATPTMPLQVGSGGDN